ncbi:MAG: transcription-repair coupling factor, partial [Pseudomonadota bacterium]
MRGAIIDLFPMGSDAPLRIDLFDDEIDSLRHFDPDTQRSGETLPRLDILPAREVPLDSDAVRAFRQRYRERFPGEAQQSQVYRDVSEGIAHGGIEYFLPLFFEGTASLLDYLPGGTVLSHGDALDELLAQTAADIAERFQVLNVAEDRPLLKPDEAFFTRDDWRAQAGQHRNLTLSREKRLDGAAALATPLPPMALDAQRDDGAAAFVNFLKDRASGPRTLLVAESAGRREALIEVCAANGIQPKRYDGWHDFANDSAVLGVTTGLLAQGMVLAADGTAVITEQAVFGRRVKTRSRRRRGTADPENVIRQLSDLSIGAPVVHEAY